MSFNIIGTILGTTGYDSHTRSLANALYKITDTRLSVNLAPGWERMVNDAELDMVGKPTQDDEINILVTTPNNWKAFILPGRNWGYCVWEGDKVPKYWIEEFLNPKIEYILVPSEHTKNAILNTMEQVDSNEDKLLKAQIASKIKIIPHGVDSSLFYKTNDK